MTWDQATYDREHTSPTRASALWCRAGRHTCGRRAFGRDGCGTARVGDLSPVGQPISDSLFLLATLYRSLYGIAGSYVAARLAPDRPMHHALVVGAIGLV